MPTVHQRKGGVITDRAIAAAKELGNITAVKELFSGITRGNFRLELVDVVFFHLQLPPLGYGSARERKEREKPLARVASFCLSNGIGLIILLSSEHQRRRVSEAILHNFDDIKYWIARITPGSPSHDPSHPLFPTDDPTRHCRSLGYMLELDVDGGLLSAEVRGSPEVLNFAVAAWAAMDPLRGRVFMNAGPRDLCPAVHLLLRLSLHEESRQIILDQLYSPGKRHLRAMVIESAISRCRTFVRADRENYERQIAALIAKGDMDPPASGKLSMPAIVFNHMDAIGRVVQGFCEHPSMRKAIRKSAFFEEYTRALHVWLVDKSDKVQDKVERSNAFQLLYVVTCLTERWPSKRDDLSTSKVGYWKAVAASSHALVRGGFVGALIESLCSVTPKDEEPLTFLGECTKWLRDMCNQDPSLAQIVYSELVELAGEFFWRYKLAELGRQNECLLDLGLNLAAGHVFPSQSHIFSCDNLRCEQNGTETTLRVCSGCEAVAYCSRRCQEDDWNALHRNECRFSEVDFHRARNPDKAPYRHSLRLRQSLILARRALIELAEDDPLQDEMEASPSVLVCNDIPDRVAIFSPEAYMEWRAKQHIIGSRPESGTQSTHYFDSRVQSLLELYENETRGWADGNYLVSATYQVGRRSVLLLVMMRMPDSAEASEEGGGADAVGMYGESCTVSYCVAAFVKPSGSL